MDELTTAAQKEVWNVVHQINTAWREGNSDRLHDLFHERMVITSPDGQRYGEGRLACVDSYRSFCQQATVTHYEESDRQVDVFETSAIASYAFEIAYTIEGQPNRDIGRDIFALEKHNGRWLAVWRQLSFQPA